MKPFSLFHSFARHVLMARGVMLRRLVLALLPGLLAMAAMAWSLLWLWLLPAYADGPVSLDPQPDWFSGDANTAYSLAWGDVDGDGDLDLAVGNAGVYSGTFGHYLGEVNQLYVNQGGFLQPSAGWVSDESDPTRSLAWGDVDGDGDLDLAVGNYGSPNQLYLNQDGVLDSTPVWTDTVDDFTMSVAWGDMNGDGYLDLAIGNAGVYSDAPPAHYLGQASKVYLNQAGALQTSTAWTAGVSDPTRSLAWGDVDGDGDLDLAVGNYKDQSRVYLNQAGTLSTTAAWNAGISDWTTSLAWGDMDSDGDLDLIIGNFRDPLRIYFNQGGSLATSAAWNSSEINDTLAIALGDANSDGSLDVAVGVQGRQMVYVNPGQGGGTSAAWMSADSDIIYSVAWGDVDGDGDLDLAVGSEGGVTKIYFNEGGSLGGVPWTSDYAGNTLSVAWGDVDGDGDLDLAAGHSGYNRLYLNENGGLHTSPDWRSSDSAQTYSVAWGDVDGDGALDLVAGNTQGPNKLYLNQIGALNSTPVWSDTVSDNTLSVAWGDVDGDGDLDLAVGNAGDYNTIYHCYMGGAANKLYLNDAGSLDSSPAWVSADGDDTTGLAWGDVDGDGDLDLAVGNGAFGGQPNRLYMNERGVLQSSAAWVSSDSDWTEAIAWGDIDGDGDLDLVAGNYVAPSKVYLNEGGRLQTVAVWASGDTGWICDIALGDIDGDGDLDMVAGRTSFWADAARNAVYMNRAGSLEETPSWLSGEGDNTFSVALGDVNGDGRLDLAAGNIGGADRLYLGQQPAQLFQPGQSASLALGLHSSPISLFSAEVVTALAPANFYAVPGIRQAGIVPITYTLFNPSGVPMQSLRAFYSPDGGGEWHTAAAASETVTTGLAAGRGIIYAAGADLPQSIDPPTTISSSLVITDSYEIADLDVWLVITHTFDQDLDVYLRSPAGTWVELFSGVGGSGNNFEHTTLSDQAPVSITAGTAPFSSTYRPEGCLAAFNGETTNGTWTLAVTDTYLGLDSGALLAWGVQVKTPSPAYVYRWDVLQSGFFGQSDDVVFRLEACPQPAHSQVSGSYLYTRTIPGPYQRACVSAQTYPFRVRGTQIRVMSDTVPAANALVYRLPEGQIEGGEAIADNAGLPFHTNVQGYLQGRGELEIGDRLLALVPITWTDTYTLYYTSGKPTEVGVNAHTVSAAGVQTLTVSADYPLLVFDLSVSLEWDAHSDTSYLEELAYNLQRASEHLYDFTNGQVALGQIDVYQNADEWGYSHAVIRASNRLRPFAAQGGIALTDTVDPQHPDIVYAPGQVTMGAIWNRYGNPGQSLGEDWAIILAHELSHYLLYHDDTYLGLDENGYLKAVATCVGSAMGDLYDKPVNTEFIADEATWQANCADTLPEKTLGRNEWETMHLWYPALLTATVNAGPASMPFDFTQVSLHDPYTPTKPLLDPTFYVEYVGGVGASTEARAYLLRDEDDPPQDDKVYAVNLGSPFGGQNRLVAYGAQPGDRLCAFDRPHAQYGCEIVAFGDNQLVLEKDLTWNPIILLTPVNSTTLVISVTNPVPIMHPVRARLYPEFGYGGEPLTLALDGLSYTGTFTTTYPAMVGDVQVWVEETGTETNPRRETMVAYGVGGNPGAMRGGGGAMRGGGGAMRGGGGAMRGGGGAMRGGGAPIVSADGQMILFTDNPVNFVTGTLFIVQAMAGLPPLPAGRSVIGQGYYLAASPGATLPLTTSVSIQYLSNDVQVAGADELDLALYYWGGGAWTELDTALDTYYNLATAPLPQPGPGIYVLMASIRIPLSGAGWNNFAYPVYGTQPVVDALLSISGHYTTVYGYEPGDSSPWRVYAPNLPPYAIDLHALEFGKGYWIQMSDTITLYLTSGASASAQYAIRNILIPEAQRSGTQYAMPLPPSTFYGVLDPEGFMRSAGSPPLGSGMSVTAWVDGHLCGQSQTREAGGRIVYAIHVLAADGSLGCGAPGKPVTFEVGAQRMGAAVTWDNNRVRELDLGPIRRMYLPVILKHLRD